MNLVRSACLAVALVVSSGSVATAQDWDKGEAAYLAEDYETALQEWRPLAEQGHAEAQVSLSGMYLSGRGVPQDYAEAVKWYLLAAEQDDDHAQYYLDSLYRYGHLQDYAETVKWVRLAAEQGNAVAQFSVGGMYNEGNGVLQDYVIAHMWYNISGANGNALGTRSRNRIERSMTPEQIADAQAMARECMSSGYTDC
jgi:TPR repeat protein